MEHVLLMCLLAHFYLLIPYDAYHLGHGNVFMRTTLLEESSTHTHAY